MADNIRRPRTSPQAYVPKRLAQGWFCIELEINGYLPAEF